MKAEVGGVNLTLTQQLSGYRLVDACMRGNEKAAQEKVISLLTDIENENPSERYAIVNFSGDNGWTPVIAAAAIGNKEILRLLLNNGGDVNARSDNNSTALIWAATRGYEDIVKLLVKKNADVNARDDDGFTALMQAVNLGNNNGERIARFLVEKRADPRFTVTNKMYYHHNRDAAQIAQEQGCLELANFLKEKNKEQTEEETNFKLYNTKGEIPLAKVRYENPLRGNR